MKGDQKKLLWAALRVMCITGQDTRSESFFRQDLIMTSVAVPRSTVSGLHSVTSTQNLQKINGTFGLNQ